MKAYLLAFCFLGNISFAQSKKQDSLLLALQVKQKSAIGKPFPAFVIYDGRTRITNDSLKGKIVFINFWFAHCGPCIAEFKGLDSLYQQLKENTAFQFISFTFENFATIEQT